MTGEELNNSQKPGERLSDNRPCFIGLLAGGCFILKATSKRGGYNNIAASHHGAGSAGMIARVLPDELSQYGATRSQDFAPYENFPRSISGSSWSYHIDF
ncbi:TPA: hypothetical protein N3A33_000058 [Salmonella enterica subsp. salamae serovar 28:r:e,n,z15]|nr:hypothetical protein [Salmonella enterica subsp. salamae serovar 28:r:e,n,z15]